MYGFRIKYVKGKVNCAEDARSGYPALESTPEESDEIED